MDDIGANLGEWNALVRRARIGEKRKYVALMVSSYANADGTGIHCGIATLAVDCEIGYSTARRYLAWMRDVGLIELVRKGNQRKGLSDEYRLIIGPDLLDHIDVPDPDRYKAAKDELRNANRAKAAERTTRARANLRSPIASADGVDLRSVKASAETDPGADDLRSARVSAEVVDLRSLSTRSALTQGERPPSLYTYPEELTFPPSEDLRTAVTATRASRAATQPDSIPDEDDRPPLRAVPDPPPDDHPPPGERRGFGFCLPCRNDGKTVLAADTVNGAECLYHLRRDAS